MHPGGTELSRTFPGPIASQGSMELSAGLLSYSPYLIRKLSHHVVNRSGVAFRRFALDPRKCRELDARRTPQNLL